MNLTGTIGTISRAVCVLLLTLSLVFCATTEPPEAGLSPEKLGRISAQIEQHPDRRQQILSRHNLTPEEYEKAVREISTDADLSTRYTHAYERALDHE